MVLKRVLLGESADGTVSAKFYGGLTGAAASVDSYGGTSLHPLLTDKGTGLRDAGACA